jgi:transposase
VRAFHTLSIRSGPRKLRLRSFSLSGENRINMHKNARLTPIGRERLVRQVESGQTPETAARNAGVCPRTARKWLARYRAEGVAGLQDRSSRPHRLHRPTPAVTMERIEALRRQRFTGQQIARDLGVSPATVSRVLRRLGLNRMAALEPAEPVRRYERERPGELIHIDIKKLASSERAIGSPAIAPARATAGASAGNTFTGPSTTIPDWPIRRSCPTRSAAPACASCSTPCASSAGMASPSSAS